MKIKFINNIRVLVLSLGLSSIILRPLHKPAFAVDWVNISGDTYIDRDSIVRVGYRQYQFLEALGNESYATIYLDCKRWRIQVIRWGSDINQQNRGFNARAIYPGSGAHQTAQYICRLKGAE